MRSTDLVPFLPLLTSLLPSASAHGRITTITTPSGTIYPGFDPSDPQPSLPAWSTTAIGNVFVPPSDFNTSSPACHFNATAAPISIPVAPSDLLKLQWNEWPLSHKGPVLTYIAECASPCSSAKAASLRWNKIDELGWINATDPEGIQLGGTWGSDVLRRNGASWLVSIPDVPEGEYVLRHEIIALHVAEMLDGAQTYPQCVSVRVQGGAGGKRLDKGVLGSELYGERDKGILVDVHGNVTAYEIPGPKMWEGATRVKQPGEV